MMKLKKRPQSTAFTLIELLVVIAIIAILVHTVPVFAKDAKRLATDPASQIKSRWVSPRECTYRTINERVLSPIGFACPGGSACNPLMVKRRPVCRYHWSGAAEDFWISLLQPYSKNFQVFVCPSVPPAGTA